MGGFLINVEGDVLDPVDTGGMRIIAHCMNDVGVMGAGVALAIRNKWPVVYTHYMSWYHNYITDPPFELGQVQFVNISTDITVANMIGQEGVVFHNGMPPIRYPAIAQCLKDLAAFASFKNATIHCPKFGSGLAGGRWGIIEGMIRNHVCAKHINVYVYELKV
jgi:O-acetyl-ADP-ribose deacetylase (regulator of RNase III)